MPSARQRTGLLGSAELLEAMSLVPEEVRTNVLAPVVDEGGKFVEGAAELYAPVDEGDLQVSIGRVVRKYPANYTAIAVVGPEAGYRGTGKRGRKQPGRTGHLAEDGHIAANGKFVPGSKFMRRATEDAAAFAIEPMAVVAEKALDRVAAGLERKYGHKRSA